MSTAPTGHGPQDRSDDQRAREDALGEVSDVLLNLEHTLARAKKALAQVRKRGGEQNIELALQDLIADIGRARKRLMQDTYYAGDAVRLL